MNDIKYFCVPRFNGKGEGEIRSDYYCQECIGHIAHKRGNERRVISIFEDEPDCIGKRCSGCGKHYQGDKKWM